MRRLAALALLALLTVGGAARADDDIAALEADELLDRIVRGVDYAASVRAFAAAVAARQKMLHAEERAAQLAAAHRAWHDAYMKSVDGIAGRTPASADPAHPPGPSILLLADWGRVTRAETVRLAPKNALDEGEPVRMVEVKGARGLYRFRANRFAFPANPRPRRR